MVRSVERLDYAQVQAARRRRRRRRAPRAAAGDRRAALRPGAGARRREPADARAGGRPGRRRRLSPCEFRPPVRRRGLERPDLAADRDGRRRRSCWTPGSGCCAPCRPPTATRSWRGSGGRPAALGRRLAGRTSRTARSCASLDRDQPAPPGAHPRGDGAVPGRGLHGLRRRRPAAARARRRRRPVRARHRAAAPARRPLRPGRLRGGVPGTAVPDAVREALPLLPT